jgi:hypothetical protein
MDRDTITRARELISNEVMSELQYEDTAAQTSFENIVRHQLVTYCQRIRVHLLVVNCLMSYYHDAVAAGKITPSVR